MRKLRMIFLALGLLVVGVVLYAITGDGVAIAGIPRDQFVQLTALLALLIFLMSGLGRLTRGSFGDAVRALGAWAAFGLVLVVLYAYRVELSEVGDRVAQEFRPGNAETLNEGVRGEGAIVRVRRGGDGHFVASTRVNGNTVRMIVDTGASTVVLRPEDARRIGLRLGDLSYNVAVQTANGRAYAARVRLERIEIGKLSIENVEALVTRPGALHRSLLGMSFLSRLRSYEFSGNQLILRS
jgi:aspartyl protease family protein